MNSTCRPAAPREAWPRASGWLPVLPGLLVLAIAAGSAAAAPASPYVPARDDEVVERLPARLDATDRARRAALAREPRQLSVALDVAQHAMARARRSGDPRDLGAAQAALAPWWTEATPPASVRVLRAGILQSRHDFAGAQADLDRVIDAADTPSAWRAQALLTRASLHQLQGRWVQARADCRALLAAAWASPADTIRRAGAACVLELDSLTEDPRQARRGLQALAGEGTDPWLALLRAELAERLGDEDDAPRLFALASAGGEVYAVTAHADWLLDRGRAIEALAVLDRGPQEADAILLRRATAWRQLGDARADEVAARLQARFDAARRRGDRPHFREEARLALEVGRDPARALALARQQWALQKEPADAVVLWRSAHAAGRAAAAVDELKGWVPDPGRADVRLLGAPQAPRSGS